MKQKIPKECSWCKKTHRQRHRLETGWRYIGSEVLCFKCVENLKDHRMFDESKERVNET